MNDVSTSNQDQRLLDEVIYLADLASSKEIIDPMLDVVRSVTATHVIGTWTENERFKVQAVHTQLKDHLIHRDPVRTFTEESLNEKLNREFGTANHITASQQGLRQVFIILAAMAAAYIAGFILFRRLNMSYDWLVAASLCLPIMLNGNSWLVFTGIRTYTSSLRRAYVWMCSSNVLLGIFAACWILYCNIVAVHHFPPMRYGAVFVLCGITFFVAYMSMRAYAQSINLTTRLAKLRFVVPLSIAVCLIAARLPHVSTSDDIYLATNLFGVMLFIYYGYMTGLIAYQIQKKLTSMYAQAIRWFGAGFTVAATGGVLFMYVFLTSGTGFDSKLLILGSICSLGGVLVFISGYMFRRSSGVV